MTPSPVGSNPTIPVLSKIISMKASIDIIPSLNPSRIDYIKLSKAKDGKTGTVSLLFVKPSIFKKNIFYNYDIKIVSLVYQGKKFLSHSVEIIFKGGKPFALKAIFVFPTKEEYFAFFQFLTSYSNENNLTYLNKNIN